LNLKERLLKELREITSEHEGEEYVDDVYLSTYEGSLPEAYIGDDLLKEIQHKFRWPINAVRRVIREDYNLGFTWLIVDPSYEDTTIVTVIRDDDHKVLFLESMKAWNYHFENEDELGYALTRIYNKIMENMR
jgi:hypothetical protein|tara:strand:+ start:544 stop:942 length:399 start_codon:yes stop_codon:yes gene_type:complete